MQSIHDFNYPLGIKVDLDNDRLSNLFEYQHNLSISDADTDHDGINDGEELNYWNETRGIDLETSLSYCRIPDVDNDSIPDGKEINGYKAKIIVGWKSDGTPISRMRFISPSELDPLTPYTNRTGVYLDSDGDGIPDVVEAWFSNVSMITDSDYRQAFKSKFGSTLFNEYRWVISYFWTVYNKDLDDHHNRTSAWQNATQWLQNQFNPMIRDHTPPMLTFFNLWWEVEFSVSLEPVKVYAHVHIVVRDAGSISYLHVVDEDSGESVTPDHYGETYYDINHKFSASLWQAGFGSVHIRVVAKDYAGNYISVEKELKGAFQQVLDALKALWDAIWNTLCKVAEAVMKAVSFIISIIEKAISTLIQGFLNLVMKGLTLWYNNLIQVIRQINKNSNKRNYNTIYWAAKLVEMTFFSIRYIIFGIYGTLTGIGILLMVISGGGATALMTLLMPIVISAVIGRSIKIGVPHFYLSKSLLTIINDELAASTGSNLTTEENKTEFNRLYTIVIGGILAVISIFLLGISAEKVLSGKISKLKAYIGFAVGLIGTLLSWGAILLAVMASYENLKENEPVTANTYDLWSLTISTLGIIFSIVSVIVLPSVIDIFVVVVNVILSLLAIAITQGWVQL